jgi:hypothetical protein
VTRALLDLAEAAGLEVSEAEDLLVRAVRPLSAPTSLRERLLAALAPAWHRFEAALAALCDLDLAAVRAVLARAESAEHWTDGPLPGVSLMHIEAGPARAGADVGLVRLGAGVTFPFHRHIGPERVIILDGSYTDDQGRAFGPGEADDRAPGDPHSFTAGTDGVVFAVVLYDGIAIALPDGSEVVVKG